MCIYSYIIHTFIHNTPLNTYVHTYTYTCIHTYVHNTYIHHTCILCIRTYVHIYAYIHTYKTYTHKCIPIHTRHACTRTRSRTQVRVYTSTRINTYAVNHKPHSATYPFEPVRLRSRAYCKRSFIVPVEQNLKLHIYRNTK